MCDTYTPSGKPLPNNHRYWANKIFKRKLEEEPWFGLEQEYFLISKETGKPLGFPADKELPAPQGQYYCSAGAGNAFGRPIAEEHLHACIAAGIKVSNLSVFCFIIYFYQLYLYIILILILIQKIDYFTNYWYYIRI